LGTHEQKNQEAVGAGQGRGKHAPVNLSGDFSVLTRGWGRGYLVCVLVSVYTLYMYRYNLTAVCTVSLLASAHTNTRHMRLFVHLCIDNLTATCDKTRIH
jgi:hypothetical protein